MNKFKPVIDKNILKRLREKLPMVKEHGSCIKAAVAMKDEFPGLSAGRISEYLTALRVSDFVFNLVMEDKISIGTLEALGRGGLDAATIDILARIATEKKAMNRQGRLQKISPRIISRIKNILAKGYRHKTGKDRVSLADAIAIACGEIPDHAMPEDVKKSMREFGGVVGEVVNASIAFMTKMQMALDLLPHSAIGGSDSYMGVFEKLITFENTLETSWRFVVERKKKFMEAIRTHVATEAMMDQTRKGGPNA